ncbi:MAG: cyclohexanecarboxylate-CoA ligase [Actinobacteria bacterium]|nr:cyclohexanecarboxylate-CoA ligase [Actinomycetota bacterium]
MSLLEFERRRDDDERATRYVAEGSWTDETLGSILAAGFAESPERIVSFRSDVRPWRGTYADASDIVRRVAGGLRAAGVGPGDVVAFQIPNWMEAAATFWAAAFLGAAVVPIVHFYGPKEVEFILRQSGARWFVTADKFGHLDFAANLEQIRPRIGTLEDVFVVGDSVPSGARAFASLMDADAIEGPAETDPMAPALIAYTSGTTADPKGVVHSHRTIGFETKQLANMAATVSGRSMLVGAPVGHAIGMLAALLIPVYRRESIFLIDVWDPKKVLAAMLEDDLSSGSGATYFLTSLLDHPDFTPEHAAKMQRIGLGGSVVPTAVSERAESMGMSVVRSFGATEHPSITGATHDEPLDKRITTDGHALPGVELELRDDDGTRVGIGEPGEIFSKGPDCFIGYTDPVLTKASIDDDGWFATGDVGVLDEAGYLTIVDRKKDIIIRGGENVSALEVEDQIVRMPGVAEVAVVAAPDPKFGEHGAAFVRMLPDGGTVPSLEQMREHLRESGLAKQKWPEEVHAIEDFPRTPSGKIKKFTLREQLRNKD